MEMIDVLTKLKEIAESKPELVKDAVENVERTNPAEVKEGALKQAMHDDAEKMSKEEFVKKYGAGTGDFWDSINGTDEGKMMKKETVKEAIQISADTPQEASMMMQILKLAGVQPVDAKMIGADEPEHGSDMVPGDDAMGSMQMAKMRDMMTAPDEEKAAETFANEPEEKVQDIDSLVNKHSGGLNRQKSQFAKSQDGDNAMAVAKEDRITEEELANSLRTQYESFKAEYQAEAKKAKPDFLDMDKDGDKKEPMKKAVKDKEEKEAK